MKVRLHLEGKYIFSEEEWDKIHDAFEFFVDTYKLDKYDVPVYIKFPDKLDLSSILETGSIRDISRGCCVTQFRQYGSKIIVERFILSITPGNFTKVIETIFHEMTHVMQELRGDIVREYDGSEVYKGVHYSVDKLTKPTYKEYRQFPWEIEAREVATEMLQKWQKSRNIKQTFWQKFVTFWS